MQYKKVDVLISDKLTNEELKTKVLNELNNTANQTDPRVSYIANIHDLYHQRFLVCVDTETKQTMGLPDEIIDLQSISRIVSKDINNPSDSLTFSSKLINDNFLKISSIDNTKPLAQGLYSSEFIENNFVRTANNTAGVDLVEVALVFAQDANNADTWIADLPAKHTPIHIINNSGFKINADIQFVNGNYKIILDGNGTFKALCLKTN